MTFVKIAKVKIKISQIARNKQRNQFFQSKSEKFYKERIKDLPKRWRDAIENNGDYIIIMKQVEEKQKNFLLQIEIKSDSNSLSNVTNESNQMIKLCTHNHQIKVIKIIDFERRLITRF